LEKSITIIDAKIFVIIGWGVKYGNSPSSPRLAKLINGMNKGIVDSAGYFILYSTDTTSIDHAWSYNESTLGSGGRHLCNGLGHCLTSRKTNVLENDGTMTWDKMGWVLLEKKYYSDDESQRFNFFDSLTYPGFYIIKDDFGKCVSVPENLDRNGAEIWASRCNSSEAGQLWQWHYWDNESKKGSFQHLS